MKFSAPTRISMPSMMARVRGMRMVTREPRPTSESMSMRPWALSMFRRTTSMPTPRPLTAVTFSAVEKPGANTRFRISRLERSRRSPTRPFSMALARMRSGSRPRPSSSTSITTLPSAW